MAESKIELTERLRREGRWADASEWKDEMVRALRAEGMKRQEASTEAWQRLAIEYPPLPITVEVLGEAEVEQSEALEVVSLPAAWGLLPDSAPFEAEVEWVHQNRVLVVEERRGGSPVLHWERARKPAPSYGAASLMDFAATNRKGFMDILQRIKPAAHDDDDANVRREQKSIAEIRAVLAQVQRQADEKLLANVPQFVGDGVRDTLADWSRQHGLTLPGDAATSLTARIADLVQRCIRVTSEEAL